MVAKTGRIQTQVLTPDRSGTRRAGGLLTLRDLAQYRKMLLDKRRAILGDINGMETEIDLVGVGKTTRLAPHDGLDAEDISGAEVTYGCIQTEAGLLREIEEALLRIEEGTYGLCMGTGRPIGKKRLRACPWAKYCIEYARALEKGRRSVPPAAVTAAGSPPADTEQDEDELPTEALADLYAQVGRRRERQLRRLLLESDEIDQIDDD